MPLGKRGAAPVVDKPAEPGVVTTSNEQPVAAPKKAAVAPMTKDDYWRRREERDVQRDKDMAWSGLAQAALDSVGLVQLNTENTLEGFVALVVKATDLLLQARNKRNS